VAAGWPDIGVFALRTLLEEHPRDVKLLHELGRLYHDMGLSNEEVEVYNRIIDIEPLDTEALKMGKDASARASMTSGGWTQAESYRDLIKDKGLAESLEQQGRMKSTGESLNQEIAETFERHQAEPQNVDLARKLGALNEDKGDVESAIAWYQYAVELTNGTDPGLTRKVSDLKMRRSDRAITELEEFLAQHGPESEGYTERAEELTRARKTRAELLVEDSRKRMERNPTDLQLRFELGEQLVVAGLYREALPELQRARQNPNARLKAMNLLGRCYRELGMMDLAMKQLEEASREIGSMDAMKKEIVYNLGLVYEQVGEREKSLTCMKQIYEADYGYKDVAERVESSYRQGASPA